MPTTYKEMLRRSPRRSPRDHAADAASLVEKSGALIVDVRDGTEVAASGKAKGAVAVPAARSNSARIRTPPTTIRPSARIARSS